MNEGWYDIGVNFTYTISGPGMSRRQIRRLSRRISDAGADTEISILRQVEADVVARIKRDLAT